MTQSQEILLYELGSVLFGNGCGRVSDENVLLEAEWHGVKALILPSYDDKTLSNNIRLLNAHASLTNVLFNIPFVTIKGYASSYYYPDPMKRLMGDVDFYVNDEYFERTYELLIKCGYTLVEDSHVRHDTFIKDRIIYELHSEIKGIPNGKEGIQVDSLKTEKSVKKYLADVIETAVTIKTQLGDVIIPDSFHHGLIMLLHVAGHMMDGEGIGLRHLCDWAVYVDKVDFQQYKHRFEEMGMWTFACQLTSVCSRYIGLPTKEWAGEWDDAFLEELITDILNAGNLGRKDTGRAAGLGMTKGNGIFASIIQMTKRRFKIYNKYPLLIPIGLVHYACVYLFERLSGKKKWVRKSNISDGKRRKKLYEQFKLFM